ncbi:hypothetical protein AURDEDRAFT_112825 [Auricularia subglabra TFB-10046 SS5]|nr:hypothetical protein AURDEDRAFT_112825 [Auricularia subglabra TFB-10046 SS5]
MKRLRWQSDFQKYTRVLEKDTVQMHKIRLVLHPYLRARGKDGTPVSMVGEVAAGEEGFIRWDMRLRTTSASFSTGPPTRTWSCGRAAPATFPPTTDLMIMSHSSPWSIPVHDSEGITVGGLLDALYDALHQFVSEKELNAAGGAAVRRLISASYHANRQELRGVLMDGLLRVDFLGERCEFGGFLQDEQLVLDKMSVSGHTTAIALVCDPRGASMSSGLPVAAPPSAFIYTS